MSKNISVIIPLYNSAKWLPKCLDSILNQNVSEEDLEIICVNDGSPDDSEKIAKRYQTMHPDSIVVLSQENQGPSGARNNGLRNATGKYLCFVDPDDYVEPNVFGNLLKQMEEQQLDMLRFNYQIVNEDYQLVEKRDFELKFDYSPCVMSGAEFLADRLDIACNIWRYIYRTEIITRNNIWFFTGDYYDDTPWLPMVLINAKRLGVCDTLVYDYQERSDSLVKGNSLQAVRRKRDGALLLIRLLKEEQRIIEGGEANCQNMVVLQTIGVDTEVLAKIKLWYDMIIAFGAVSLLTNVAAYDYVNTRMVLKELNDLKVFPLSTYRSPMKVANKIRMINTSPCVFCHLVHLRNSFLSFLKA